MAKKNLPAQQSAERRLACPDSDTLKAMEPEERLLNLQSIRNEIATRKLPGFLDSFPVDRTTGKFSLALNAKVQEVTHTPDLAAALAIVSAAAAGQYFQADPDAERSRALSHLAALAPEDHLQAMLAAQMVAVNSAIQVTLYRSMLPEQTTYGKESNMTNATKLQRTFLAQVETYQKLKGRVQQSVEVKHVHIHEGGQAVIGQVTHNAKGISPALIGNANEVGQALIGNAQGGRGEE